MKKELNYFDVVIDLNDTWDSINLYEIYNIQDGCYILKSLSYSSREKIEKEIDLSDHERLFIYPLSIFMRGKYQEDFEKTNAVGDFLIACLGKNKSLNLSELSEKIIDKYRLNHIQIECILRFLTAAKLLVATCKNKDVSFRLSHSPLLLEREKQRKFAATVASELTALSERVRNIIGHSSTVGTYRENILQNLLRKNLPERYHVATGFIYGLEKQIDVLIYDRLDYAPIFREVDLVVVPPEAVRAVIEVKTKLDYKNLRSALMLLDKASKSDDNNPPFFKGIYAFESDIEEDKLYEHITDFYTNLSDEANGGDVRVISRPFQHLTSMCVSNKAYAYIEYAFNKNNRLVPELWSKSSSNHLGSQSSFFMQSLLSHLRYGGMKTEKLNYLGRMLGEDAHAKKIKDLKESDDSWWRYFDIDEGYVSKNDVMEMEEQILTVKRWLEEERSF